MSDEIQKIEPAPKNDKQVMSDSLSKVLSEPIKTPRSTEKMGRFETIDNFIPSYTQKLGQGYWYMQKSPQREDPFEKLMHSLSIEFISNPKTYQSQMRLERFIYDFVMTYMSSEMSPFILECLVKFLITRITLD